MSNAKDAIRAELAEVREKKADAIASLEEKVARFTGREEALETALAALDGFSRGRGPDKKKRVRAKQRDVQVLDLVRHSVKPVSAADLAKNNGLPGASTARSIERLIVDGKVKKVGETPRGAPRVEHVPVTIRPGEGVGEQGVIS